MQHTNLPNMDFFIGGQYLILGGGVDGSDYDTDETPEVVELLKTDSTPSFGKLPYPRWGSVGAMMADAPILCGGNGFDDEGFLTWDTCIHYQNSKWSLSHTMNEKRRSTAGVKINSTVFWILGGTGESYDNLLNSTEFIIQDQTKGVPGPILPYELEGTCAVKLSEKEIFVIGGADQSSYRKEVWIYDPQNDFSRSQGPSLNVGRSDHGCSTMKDGDKNVIVVVGGVGRDGELESVEIYDPIDKTWHEGKTNY